MTGSQLYSLGDNVAASLGGGSYKDGKWSAPTFKFKIFDTSGEEKDGTYKNVAEALTGVGASITNINNKFTEQINNALLWDATDQAFVARRGEGGDKRLGRITDIASGYLTINSTDAVTGSQMYILGTNLANYLGGGADFQSGNSVGPTFKIKTFENDGDGEEKNTTYQNVSDAFEGVNIALTTVQNKVIKEINNAIANVRSDSLVKWNEETKLIKLGEEKEGTKITVANKDNESRVISGVKEGIEDTDAVNFSQLQKVEKEVKEQVAASSFVKQDSET
ncbi:hypothetical protein MCY_01303, partial [Bartonella rattimassiliensis 15908]